MYALNAEDPKFLTYESGSFPSGKSKILTFNPSSSNMSVPRSDAFIPASSPSYNMVTFLVKRAISRIWAVVKDVPEEETTFSTPA
ncbi:hypothetical protein D3C87_1647100 [compost metagenome]